MNSRDREKIQRNYRSLLDVAYSTISPHLISTFVLTLEMHEEIESKPTERKKMEKLINILPTRGENALSELVEALRSTYPWIADKLEEANRPESSPNSNNHARRNLPELSVSPYIRDVTRILQRSSGAVVRWNILANTMGLLPTTIQDIKREMTYGGGHELALYSVLENWADQQGNSRATFSKLVSLLRREKMMLCADEVTEYWATLEFETPSRDGRHQPARRERERSPIISDV